MITAIETEAEHTERVLRGLDDVALYIHGLEDCVAQQEARIAQLERQLSSRRAPTRRGEGFEIMLVSKVGDGGYSRKQPFIIVEWDCVVCHAHHQRSQLPGPTPRYCQPLPGEKSSPCQRAARRQTVERFRRNHPK